MRDEKPWFRWMCSNCDNLTEDYPSNSICKKCGSEDDFEVVWVCPSCDVINDPGEEHCWSCYYIF
jgi:uncharacterized OB-fold protein